MLLAILISLASAEALRIQPDDKKPFAEADFWYPPYPDDAGNLEKSETISYMKSAAEEVAMRESSLYPLRPLTPLNDAQFNVPFYVYDEVDWMSTKCDNVNLTDDIWAVAGATLTYDKFKHSDDFWFLKAALNHKMRTKDPKQAKLFVVPALFNLAVEQKAYRHKKCCVGEICNEDFFPHTDNMLSKSPWFNRNKGKDHVVLCSHYACGGHLRPFKNLAMCNSISFEANSMKRDRCHIASTYVGRKCGHRPKKFMFALVASMKKTFTSRRTICEWLSHLSTQFDKTYTVSVCGTGKQCPSLAQSRFGPHIKGDTWGSNRLIDIILSGTVPMFTNEAQYHVLPPFVPWKNISTLVDISNRQGFYFSIKESVPHYDALRREVGKYAPRVDWETPAPFEQYMWLFQQCI